ncbi:chemotaxis protein CheR [Thalassospira marina]|uniref:protein-glutamate O-methyltransferase n=1 Tax=Thalassospira marina TaxID=2048283 RepID=A0A2N3L0E2_9PROT|nr:chemotaxis protein CheR [Thalassospira marina]
MKPEDFDFVSKLIKSRSGLVLTQDKFYLLESRLMPIARKRGLKDLGELIGALRGMDRTLIEDVVEAMTTNESFFFRDTKPFDQFRHVVLPHMIKARASKRHLRIWCAAASSGQEPYSLAMILQDFASQLTGWRIDIIGTDISREILNKARAGLYSQFEVQRGLPITLLVKHFQKADDMWQISADLRSKVQYREYNLLEDLKPLGQFDVVYCRNVLIYFDQPTKTDVLSRIAAQMPDDGFLFLGGAETVLGISDKFKPLARQRGIYQLNRPGAPDVDVSELEKAQAGGATGAAATTGGGFAFPKPKSMQGSAGSTTPSSTGTSGLTPRPTSTTGTTSTTTPRSSFGTSSTTGGTGSTGSTYSRPSTTGGSTLGTSRYGTGSTGSSSSSDSSSGYQRPTRPAGSDSAGSTGSSFSSTRPSTPSSSSFSRTYPRKPDDKKD